VVTFVILPAGEDTWVSVLPSVRICAAKTKFDKKNVNMVRTAAAFLAVLDLL
jgi:hypothetical protein